MIKEERELREAKAGPVGQATQDLGRDTLIRKLKGFLIVLAAAAFFVGFMFLRFAGAGKAEAPSVAVSAEDWTAEKLEVKVRRIPDEDPGLGEPIRMEAGPPDEAGSVAERRADREVQGRRPISTDTPPIPLRRAVDWDAVYEASAGSMVVSEPPPVQGSKESPRPRMRHVPRGTMLEALLLTPIISDNLETRFRALLTEAHVVAGETVLPEGMELIGVAEAPTDRWQWLTPARVESAIYPDREREIEFDGLVLDDDQAAHLKATDIDYRTTKSALAVAGLAALGAGVGHIGRTSQTLPELAAADAAHGLSELAETPLEKILKRPPTLSIDAGRRIWVFVDASFDAPVFRELYRFSESTFRQASEDPGNASAPADSYGASSMDPAALAASLERLQGLRQELGAKR